MSIRAKSAVDQKLQFIQQWLKKQLPLARLCQEYGISLPPGDQWITRYQREGEGGLKERSHAANERSNALDGTIEALIFARAENIRPGGRRNSLLRSSSGKL
jgi:putative transposase